MRRGCATRQKEQATPCEKSILLPEFEGEWPRKSKTTHPIYMGYFLQMFEIDIAPKRIATK
jgi:hypothetical protein